MTKTVKRTRRLENPLDATIEVRLYSTEKAKLKEEAAARGMTASDLVRSQLGNLIAAAPPERAVQAQEPDAATVSLSEAIAAATGGTIGEALLTIKLGKVTVGGSPWPHTEIPADLISQVRVSGESLAAASVLLDDVQAP